MLLSGSEEERWVLSNPEYESNWINVSGLEHGATYEIRIVARNNDGDETRSEKRPVTIITQQPGGSWLYAKWIYLFHVCKLLAAFETNFFVSI